MSAEAKLDVSPRRGVNEGAREGRLGRKRGQNVERHAKRKFSLNRGNGAKPADTNGFTDFLT